jgi:hypothetical protein
MFATRSPSTYLFTIKAGVTFTLEYGVVLAGLQSASKPSIGIDGGEFIMNGGTIKDSIIGSYWFGGGVDILNGTFTMNGGTISGNSCSGGGGVCVGENSTFIMTGGTISRNTAISGGGVYVGGGTFTMNDGTISGNTADKSGGGVIVSGGTFTKSGTAGIIYGSDAPAGQANQASQYGHAVYTPNGSRDTTAHISRMLDSSKYGSAGGWE